MKTKEYEDFVSRVHDETSKSIRILMEFYKKKHRVAAGFPPELPLRIEPDVKEPKE